MMTWGTPISGNPHILIYNDIYIYILYNVLYIYTDSIFATGGFELASPSQLPQTLAEARQRDLEANDRPGMFLDVLRGISLGDVVLFCYCYFRTCIETIF